MRLLASDLGADEDVSDSLAKLEPEIEASRALLAAALERAAALPHRERYLRLVHRLGELQLAAYEQWLDEGANGTVRRVSAAREGGCSCGAVRYRLASEPMFVHCCHCLNCQRQTGSAFVINLLIEADRVELLAGEPQPVDVPRDDGSTQRIYRCPTCQVAVFSEYGRPEVRFVRAGTLDEPSSVTPDVHIFTRSKVPWVTLPGRCRRSRSTTTRTSCGRAESLERLDAVLARA